MSDTGPYPYETRLNVFYKPLEIVEEKQLSDNCKFQWYNQTLCQVNGSSYGWGYSVVNTIGTNTRMMMSFSTSLRVNS